MSVISSRTSLRIAWLLPALTVGATPATAASSASGAVTYATAHRAYLDRGAQEGLAVGDVLRLSRNGRDLYGCSVLFTSAHAAACAADGARVGDRFAVPAGVASPPAPRKPAPPLPAQVSAEESQRRLDALAAAGQPLVEYHAPPGFAGRRPWSADAALGHQGWVAFAGANGTFQAERLDLTLRGLPVAGPFDLFVDATLLHYTARPDTVRFRPGASTQGYLREAELQAREIGRPWALSVGRIWPYNLPGFAALDGAQGGWRSRDGTAEAGVFAGGLPDAERIVPADAAFAAGGYWAVDRLARGRMVPVLHHEGSLGVVDTDSMTARIRLDLGVGAALLDGLDVSAAGRLGVDSDGKQKRLELGRLEVSSRPRDDLSLTGGYRHLAEQGAPLAGDAFVGYGDGSDRGDLSASWDVRRWLSLGAQGGAATDANGSRLWAGPDFGFPTAFGRVGGLRVGYQEELGTLAGRAAFVQAVLSPADRLRLLLRLSYAEERHDDDAGGTFTTREGGLFTDADLRILDWLDFRATVLGRAGIVTSGTPPAGVVVLGQLAGHVGP